MDFKEFRLFANNRILQTIIKVNGKKYPTVPVKMPPLCYLDFNENAVLISDVEPLFNKQRKTPMAEIRYTDIQKIEIGPIKKMTVVVFAPGTRINLDLKIFLKDGSYLHFECEDVSVVSKLSSFLASQNVELTDEFELVFLFKDATSDSEAYEKLNTRLDEITEEQQTNFLRLKQTEH